ncbi:hypothetical protein H9P43_006055 [Blastocladiella emersonii ATCC 22665]|nr:hypothetical protein H9P43_006055 [Blastocladiella emersonii ATCC 22665]
MEEHGDQSINLPMWNALITGLRRCMDIRDPATLELLGQIHSVVLYKVGIGRDPRTTSTYLCGLISALSYVSTAQGASNEGVVALLRRWTFFDFDAPVCPPWVNKDEPWHGSKPGPDYRVFIDAMWTQQGLAVAADAIGFADRHDLLLRLIDMIFAGGPRRVNLSMITNANVWTSLAEAAIRLGDGDLALKCLTDHRIRAGAPVDAKMAGALRTMVASRMSMFGWMVKDPRYLAVQREFAEQQRRAGA